MRRGLEHPRLEFAAATLAALVLTFVAFGPGLRSAFVSDDVNAIVENEWVAGDFDPAGIVQHLSWWGQGRSDSPGYRPAATLSFALNRLAGGADPYGYRVVNFVLNALCAGLLFSLARALGIARAAAGAAAAVFAVLPIHSEAVIWIVGRAELGAAAGFLLSALLCVLYRRGGGLWLLPAAATTIAVGIGFKENALTALAVPAVFFVCGRRDALLLRRDAAATAALLAGIVGAAGLRFLADGPASLAAPESLLDNPLSVLPIGTRLLGALAVFGRYVALTFWPSSLSVDYSYDALGIGPGFIAGPDTAVAVAFLAACVWAVLRGPWRRDIVAAGLLLAAASYSIVSNTAFVLGTILGERLFYLPTAGLCIAAAAMLHPLVAGGIRERRPADERREPEPPRGTRQQRRQRRREFQQAPPLRAQQPQSRVDPQRSTASDAVAPRREGRSGGSGKPRRAPDPRILAVFAVGMLVLAGAMVTIDRRRASEWRTAVSLFESAVKVAPRSARAHMELASAYGLAGRLDDATAQFEAAMEIYPRYTAAAYNHGNTLARAGRYAQAAATYRKALEINPRFARAWRNLALTERLRGNTEGWVEALRGAEELAPSPELQNELGEALLAAGRNEEAVTLYEGLTAGGGAVAASYFNLGVARHHLGGCPAAVEDYRRATTAPAPPREAFVAAAGCLRELGRNDEAAAIERAGKVANRDTRR